MLTKEEKQSAITRVLKVLRHRFSTTEDARHWMESGKVPGYGDRSAMDLIAEGHADWVCEVIEALDAGVHS